MDQEFINGFMPRIFDVLLRDETHWRHHDFQVVIPSTRMCNLGFVIQGEGTLEINGIKHQLQKGCVYHISPPGSSLIFSTNATNPLLYIAVHFDYRLIQWEGMELLSKEPAGALPLPHVLTTEEDSWTKEKFQQLQDGWNEKQPGYEWRCRALLVKLLSEVEKRQHSASLALLRSEQSMRGAMEHVHSQFKHPKSRLQMARECSMSISNFSLLFKRISGYSYVSYINKIRMERAKSLLRNGIAPINEIAYEVGYSDPLYFSRLFSRETGMSPREYRQGQPG
ncbi:AraC family transcriptional regulator [Paenibacillus gansuensis]|uniref:Helix-turn-helix domain-containing protein n=1 Tax=Paenibacillus gansuensis TaxID=306542 RepID=A0ABW5PB36_9BACL